MLSGTAGTARDLLRVTHGIAWLWPWESPGSGAWSPGLLPINVYLN